MKITREDLQNLKNKSVNININGFVDTPLINIDSELLELKTSLLYVFASELDKIDNTFLLKKDTCKTINITIQLDS